MYIDLSDIPGIRVDLRYATKNNFTGEILYSESAVRARLHKAAAIKLRRAAEILARVKPQWSFLILDALRPRSVQRKMFGFVKGTPQEIYVADPDEGSLHNFGLAVDLTLADDAGLEIDMGTPFDSFQDLAEPRQEDKFLASGQLTKAQVDNRRLLRSLMTAAGFEPIPFEWWHFNAVSYGEAKAKYQIVE